MKKIFDLPVCGYDPAESLKAMYNRRATNSVNY